MQYLWKPFWFKFGQTYFVLLLVFPFLPIYVPSVISSVTYLSSRVYWCLPGRIECIIPGVPNSRASAHSEPGLLQGAGKRMRAGSSTCMSGRWVGTLGKLHLWEQQAWALACSNGAARTRACQSHRTIPSPASPSSRKGWGPLYYTIAE